MKRILFILMLGLVTVSAAAQSGRRNHHEAAPVDARSHSVRHQDHRHVVECATHEQMQMSMRVLNQQSFDDKKLEVAKLCVTLGHFCVDDLARIATVFSFDDSRLAFLTYAYDYCPDRQHYYSLREVFTFSSNFSKLMDAVQPKHPVR